MDEEGTAVLLESLKSNKTLQVRFVLHLSQTNALHTVLECWTYDQSHAFFVPDSNVNTKTKHNPLCHTASAIW